MNSTKVFGLVCLAVLVVLLTGSPLLADDKGSAPFYGAGVGAGIGAGLIIFGAALGFGKIGAAALESMARQPETAARVQTAMIIIGALLEGATFFGLVICFTIGGKA